MGEQIKQDFGDNKNLKVTMRKIGNFYQVEGHSKYYKNGSKKNKKDNTYGLVERHMVNNKPQANRIYDNILRMF